MNTNEEKQIRVDPCVLVLDFIHANDSLGERDRGDGIRGWNALSLGASERCEDGSTRWANGSGFQNTFTEFRCA